MESNVLIFVFYWTVEHVEQKSIFGLYQNW